MSASRAQATGLDGVLRAHCVIDARLRPVAEAARSDPEGFDPLELRELAHRQGVAAPTVQALVLRGGADTVPVVVARWLRERGATPTLSRCAVVTGGAVLALALVPRLVEPRAMSSQGATRSWRLLLPEGMDGAALLLTAPDGGVSRRALDAEGMVSVRFDRDGPWTLQVLANLPSGPVPVALWEEHVGASTLPTTTVDASVTNDRHLTAAINRLRSARGLTTLRRDPLLDMVAMDHARRLAAEGVLAHTPTPGESPVDRLRGAGVSAERVAENLARARSLAVAHARIANSPGHRANLLDPEIDALGIGVVRTEGMTYLVELFALRPSLVGR